MTRKHSSSSSQSASYYPSTVPKSKHANKIPKQKVLEEEEDDISNYSDADAVEYETEEETEKYEEEEEANDDDDGDDDVVSESNPLHDDPSSSKEAYNSDVPESLSNSSSNVPIPPQTKNASSYIKVAPLPIFRGTPNEHPITHLSRLNKVCRANNASSIEMQKKIFPVTLEEESALWYDLNIEPYYLTRSWDEIKLSFLQAYYEIEFVEELKSELMGIRQGEKECVRSYFPRLQWILKRWPEHGLEDDVIKGVFVKGLREEFHDWVLLQKPKSLNDALRFAFDFEHLRRVRGKKEMVYTCGFCEGPHEESSCDERIMETEWEERGRAVIRLLRAVGRMKKDLSQGTKHNVLQSLQCMVYKNSDFDCYSVHYLSFYCFCFLLIGHNS